MKISRHQNVLLLALVFSAVLCMLASAGDASPEKKQIRIIATSDQHGKFVPWNYAWNQEERSGSMAQLATAIGQYRTDNTLLVDAGDTIQDNSAEIFLNNEDVHPMIQGLRILDYDVWVTGNHDYNYGLDVTKKVIKDLDGRALTGNVRDENGEPIADGYAIFDIDGILVAVIGMVTPVIARWDAENLKDCTVSDPLEETRKIIDAIQGQYDVLAGVFHMGLTDEYGVPNSGVTDILNACPEFDVMVSSHQHLKIEGEYINGVLVVQNKDKGQTMAVVDLELENDGDGWHVADRTSEIIDIAPYEPDPSFVEKLSKYDEQAKAEAVQVVGKLEGGPLVPENEIAQIPTALIQDTALIDLINRTQMYYAGTEVSAAALFSLDANIQPGDIRNCDLHLIYNFDNTLYKIHMNGAQLKKYMEWSAGYYNTYHPGDLTVSFNSDIPTYLYDMFEGVNYEINVSKEPGSRIENLTWPDGTPVKDEDEFDIAVNNYRAMTQLLTPGEIFEEDDIPQLVEGDIRGDIGSVQQMIGVYIEEVKGGTITPEVTQNWKITGNDWDPELHLRVVDMAAAGEIEIPGLEDGWTPNIQSITVDDLK